MTTDVNGGCQIMAKILQYKYSYSGNMVDIMDVVACCNRHRIHHFIMPWQHFICW